MTNNKGKLAIVTGASTGIGYELACCCAEDGFDLLIAAGEGDVVTVLKNKLLSAAALFTPSETLAEEHRKRAEPGSANK